MSFKEANLQASELKVASESMLLTGGADSVVHIWRDNTIERETEEIAEKEIKADKEQKVINLIARKKFVKVRILLLLKI